MKNNPESKFNTFAIDESGSIKPLSKILSNEYKKDKILRLEKESSVLTGKVELWKTRYKNQSYRLVLSLAANIVLGLILFGKFIGS